MTTTKWVLDPAHSEISFKVKHLMISTVTGTLDKFNIEVNATKEDFSDATITFTGDITSINTHSDQRDTHLKSADFFDSEKYPQIKFVSESVHKKSDASLVITGNLTIRNITKSVEVHAEFGGIGKDPFGNVKAGFSVDTKINREDFGLTWNAALETGGVLVGAEVRVLADIQLIKQG
jgi:polyisoprenoid-binding protein YceI